MRAPSSPDRGRGRCVSGARSRLLCIGRGRCVSVVRSRLLCMGRGQCVSVARSHERRPDGYPALASRALTASPRVFVTSCCCRARTRHPSRPPLHSHRTPIARVLVASVPMRGMQVTIASLSSLRRLSTKRACGVCCREQPPTCRGSRRRATRATGSAGRSGWRGRARRVLDATTTRGDAVSAREGSAGTRRPTSTTWSTGHAWPASYA
jgi:hypothetical protein